MQASEKKNPQKDLFEMLPKAIASLKKNIIDPFFGEDNAIKYADNRPPLRSEIFTEEQLEMHAKGLAHRHTLIEGHPAEQLLKRLAENESILLEVHAMLSEAVKDNIRIVPAGEWLLDNFYLIEEQIYTGKKHLPKGYSKGLPRLAKGESIGFPRVYDIAVEIISHSDGHVDINSLLNFVNSYQTNVFLKLGELWAIPIMLRLALIENLRRLSIQISVDITNKALANYWADEMLVIVEKDPKNLVLVIADMARSEPPMDSSFVAELTRRLQEKGNSLSLPLNWIDQRLSERGSSTIEMIQQENQKLAADQVSISNSISSLRFLSNTDWRDFVESTSIVHSTLLQDINNTFSNMDFHTRDCYRHSVEKIAKYSGLSEQEVAILAINLAKENIDVSTDQRLTHVGYYLIDGGYKKIAKQAKMHNSTVHICRSFVRKIPLFFYIGGIAIITFFITWLLIKEAHVEGLPKWPLAFLGITSFFATSQLAVALINWLTTKLSTPSLLPRMDYSKGIPVAYRTMVVIPTMLNSLAGLDTLIEGLEVRFLANRDEHLHFALLTDFRDAATETLAEDEALLQGAKTKIIALNKKYDRQTNDTFFIFHRPRKWNPNDKIWMGYERKRGKLGELNALIHGQTKENFSLIIGDEAIYTKVRYIITLDTDTQLPRDTAWKLVGNMAHPLNHALYCENKKRVTHGYTILQPRVTNSLPGEDSSIYARIHGNEPGTDPYTRAVSDVYQDLFKEGSFIGKGIYDIKLFEQAIKNRFPENRILSHDLLEGSYSRSGLVTDVQLYEDYPIKYSTDMQRRHRWIRGDWQIASWILPFIPAYPKGITKNPLSLLSKWKIFDNIRRSIVPFSFLLLFIYGWIFSYTPMFWTTAVILIIITPSIVNFIWDISRKPKDVIFKQHFIFSLRAAKDHFLQQAIALICLPYEVFSNTDAIVRTSWRICISRKKLLQWNPFSSELNNQKSILSIYATMWFAPFFAILIFAYLIFYNQFGLLVAIPILTLWMLAPFVTWWVSLPNIKNAVPLTQEQNVYLRTLARKIWSFFETFVTEHDNWLPPDNYQEHPAEMIAHRTSPTNIGLTLLANITALDFGYITTTILVERTSNTISTMLRMEKYRGHLYNWYDTISLTPLHPKYVSTVDSGNLVGHLITLKQALLSIADDQIISEKNFEGLLDSLNILIEKTKEKTDLQKFKQEILATYKTATSGIAQTKEFIDSLEISFSEIQINLDLDPDNEDDWWAEKVAEQIRYIKNELAALASWLLLPAIPAKFEMLLPLLPLVPSLKELAKIEQVLLHSIIQCYSSENSVDENAWLTKFRESITESSRRAKELILTLDQLAIKCSDLLNIDYDFLYDRTQHLLTIGYNVDEQRKDNSYYDLLASEARLTTFVAIAQGKLPQESWFALGRQLTNVGTTPILLSWSGSMFEYLMPLLVMPSYGNTLLDQTNKAVVQKQIEYAKKRGVPWGISESGYNMVDAHLNYQYKAFGVPGLGFKRGLGEDTVIAPYAFIMSLMVAPDDAYKNLQTLKDAGFESRYGFYEAIDYTAARLLRRQTNSIVRSFMAHHQGMSFLSISFLLHQQPMQKRFVSDVHVKSALLLLQERIPRVTTFYSPSVHAADINLIPVGVDTSMRVITTPHTIIPEVVLLSNGRYHSMITNAGGGYSKWKNIAVTRWREDATCDNWGTFCYIRDLDNNVFWSGAYQPTLQQGENYEAVFSQGRAEFRRKDFSLETHTEIVVSPEDDIELRRIHITNKSRKRKIIEITSYAEVVLATADADEAHPAFSNLFVQTEIIKQRHAIICTRRPRAENEAVPWMFHLMKVNDAEIKNISYETDRLEFIGRGNTINNPKAMLQTAELSGSDGAVLDPIVSIQYRIVIEPHETAIIDMIYGIGDTKEICTSLIEKYQDRHLTNRILELAFTHSQVILRQLNATEADAQLYAKLAGSVIFANASLRADAAVLIKNKRGQSGLWSYSISGDLPIILLQIEDAANIELVKQMVQAHAYFRLKGLLVDLVIWNEDHGGYRQVLHNDIISLIAPGTTINAKDIQGGIFIRSADQISTEDRILFQSVARVVIADNLGTLEEQINRRSKLKSTIPYFSPTKFHASVTTSVNTNRTLLFDNGIGGFSQDGKEYIITTTPNKPTPAPWINVLANPNFGCIISESGQSYTWLENAHEFRLTPWNNDSIIDLKGEAFYLRDEESGKFWSPAPLPCRGQSPYISRHGFGYSIFEHSEDGIESEMTVFTDIEAPIKFIILKLKNNSNRARRISATGYVEWVLGDLRAKTLMHLITEMDWQTGAILVSNAYNTEFENRIAFFDVEESNKTFTTDRAEFIGRNGTMSNPDAMSRAKLSGKLGAALDTCTALQTSFDLPEEGEREIIFRLGAGINKNELLNTINKFKGKIAAKNALTTVHNFWRKNLGCVQIQTPDVAINIMANGWLNYQTLACRIWARSGFYQSGGAFGFRDQLQDVLSLVHNDATIVKQQIVLAASRQFNEGDVQHWWHPPMGRGVRTTCSDDFLWLPFVVNKYITITADVSILDEEIYFLESRLLNEGEESNYDLPVKSNTTATLYAHCVKAIEHGLKFGIHGLPFIGTGDWNDGMDKVGNKGKGESVWLAWFLYDILTKFTTIANLKNDTIFSKKCSEEADTLRININKNAWDGDWYKRAYFDDGTPLGSKENEECKIDSIAQSWSVLSKGGDVKLSLQAMNAADKYLVKKEDKIIQLFNPPFDKSTLNPGYIKGYVPGVRENGGQYTHAAVWLIMAFAELGNKEKTWELLQMINPINHGSDTASIANYKVEPYVIAADVYAQPQHKGRGGWTWYTGSAGWMYQMILESFIGLKREGNTLHFKPCIPANWESVKIDYTFLETVYHIELIQANNNENNTSNIFMNNINLNTNTLTLINDKEVHEVKVML